MINNVCKALRSIFSWHKGDCTNDGVKSPQGASEEGELVFNEVNIPDDVSEPVISFVKCFRENPKRFKLSCEWCSVECSLNMTQVYFIEDKVVGVKYIYYEWPLQDSFVGSI